jgi:hypothetical protein
VKNQRQIFHGGPFSEAALFFLDSAQRGDCLRILRLPTLKNGGMVDREIRWLSPVCSSDMLTSTRDAVHRIGSGVAAPSARGSEPA